MAAYAWHRKSERLIAVSERLHSWLSRCTAALSESTERSQQALDYSAQLRWLQRFDHDHVQQTTLGCCAWKAQLERAAEQRQIDHGELHRLACSACCCFGYLRAIAM